MATKFYKYELPMEEICLNNAHRSIKSLKRYLKVSERDVLAGVLKRVQEGDKLNNTTQQYR